MSEEPPAHLIDWQRQRLDARVRGPAAHPNARFAVSGRAVTRRSRPSGRTPRACRSTRCCSAGAARRSSRSSPRRSTGSTACFSARSMSSEKTAAAAGTVGELRFDPFAMLPFCGYNMADYFAHWLEDGARRGRRRTCRRSSTSTGSARTRKGRFLWPGYGENSRVLSWVFAPLRRPWRGEGDPDRAHPAGRRRGNRHPRRGRRRDAAMARAPARGRRGVEGPAATVPRVPAENSTAYRPS